MNEQHPTVAKITDLKDSLAKDKEGALAAMFDSEHRDVYKSHVHTLIEDLKWIFERMGADGP